MLIHRVALRNIRSYEDAVIDFDEGITLLAGDIGAGKSTILQGIEFALFGSLRGNLDGESLLRHGSQEGVVSVTFSLRDREYTVTRALKRAAAGVRQTDCSLTTDGVEESLSAVELKARILALLGYPEALLTKSKGLIFRHTVYTPQEEMKHIIFMPGEERLNVLRSLFGIERYRTIKENAQLLLRELRAKERLLAQESAGIPGLEREHKATADREAAAQATADAAAAEAKRASALVHALRADATKARAAWQHASELEQRRHALLARARELARSRANLAEDIERVEAYLAAALAPVEDRSEAIEEHRRKLDALAEQLLDVSRKRAGLTGQASLLREQERSIGGLETCPVCRQAVGPEHKRHVHVETEKQTASIGREAGVLQAAEDRLRGERTALQREMAALAEHQKRFAAYSKELLVRTEQERSRARHRERLATLDQEAEAARRELAGLPEPDPAAKAAFEKAHQALETAETAMQERLAALGQAREALGGLQATATVLVERLRRAKEAQQEAARLQAVRAWIETHFLELVGTVEQHVLASIHAEFRELFAQWFARLVEDETMSVSLGERFEPLVSQNGYDSTLEQLSGGEKTAVALSYRLSLYRVVSDFISTIATKDVLILDEPTDGFSSEQLDRVRDVLRELGCRQVILVSHEARMEGGCDHVIRVEKRQHRSEAR